jgi:hypothetical protein
VHLRLKFLACLFDPDQRIIVQYDGIVVEAYAIDMSDYGTIIVDLQAIKPPDSAHAAQCRNDLKPTISRAA